MSVWWIRFEHHIFKIILFQFSKAVRTSFFYTLQCLIIKKTKSYFYFEFFWLPWHVIWFVYFYFSLKFPYFFIVSGSCENFGVQTELLLLCSVILKFYTYNSTLVTTIVIFSPSFSNGALEEKKSQKSFDFFNLSFSVYFGLAFDCWNNGLVLFYL